MVSEGVRPSRTTPSALIATIALQGISPLHRTAHFNDLRKALILDIFLAANRPRTEYY